MAPACKARDEEKAPAGDTYPRLICMWMGIEILSWPKMVKKRRCLSLEEAQDGDRDGLQLDRKGGESGAWY